jgi:hypothetical protein
MSVLRRCVTPWIDMRPAGVEGTADVGGSPAWRSGERLTTATVKSEVVMSRGPGLWTGVECLERYKEVQTT